jgi:hypothetical protein
MVRDDMTHPPLHYLLLKFITPVLGTGEFGFRALSLFCGIATIGLIAMLGSRLPGARWCGLLAASIMAVSRFPIYYSQESRSFALYTFLVTLLALWVHAISRHPHQRRLWLSGLCIMTLLLYTHWYSSLFITSAVLALLISSVPTRTKLLAVATAAGSALLFIPWILAILSIYRSNTLNDQLNWYGHPTLWDLKKLWAASLGIMDFHGAITATLVLILLLAAAALVLVSRKETLRNHPTVVALAIMAILPPLIVFILSVPPFNHTLFGLRHFLPSMAALLLLCCFGLERLSQASRHQGTLVALSGAALLLAIATIPTIQAMRAGPFRFPFDRLAQKVQSAQSAGTPAYVVKFYKEGEPLNYYCHSLCTQPLPTSDAQLPARLMLIYQPLSPNEASRYRQLIQEGYIDQGHLLYTNGYGNDDTWGTIAATLQRPK